MEDRISYLYDALQYLNSSLSKDVLKLLPKTEKEFLSISGIGETFIERNKSIIKQIEDFWNNLDKVKFSSEINKKLDDFKQKLDDVSQRNNMIWNSKETKSRFLDLKKLDLKNLEEVNSLMNNFFKSTQKSITLKISKKTIDEYLKQKENNTTIESLESKYISFYFSNIERENKSLIQEKGINQLYVAKYFLNGRRFFQNKELFLRAPIFLFPVKFVDSKNSIHQISNDYSRDILINEFVLNSILSMNFEYNEELTLEQNINQFIANSNGNISDQIISKEKFESINLKQNDFVLDELFITDDIVLGLFSVFNNSIKNEIQKYLNENKISKLLFDMFSEGDMHSIDTRNQINNDFNDQINDDSKIFNYNDLNFYQIEALKKINNDKTKGLTIWGPPGTGKSETIIAIIQDAIAKKQRVVIVSEKQVALKVIKDRLGELANSSILVSDIKDKLSFYSQLKKAFEFKKYDGEYFKDFNSNIKKIYDEFDSLYLENDYSKKLTSGEKQFYKTFFDKKYYPNQKIKDLSKNDKFQQINRNDFKKVLDFKKEIEQIKSPNELNKIKKIINDFFLNYSNFSEIKSKIIDSINQIKKPKNIFDIELHNLDKINNSIEKFNTSSFLKFKLKKTILSDLNQNFNYSKEDVLNFDLKKRKSFLISKIDYFEKELKRLHTNLKFFENHLLLIEKVYKQDKVLNDIILFLDQDEINFEKSKLEIISTIIWVFSSNNELIQKQLNFFNNYNHYFEKVKELNSNQKEYNKNLVLTSTSDFLSNFSCTNRYEKLKKVIESKRPPQIKKFMNDFSIEMNKSIPIWLLQTEIVPIMFSMQEKFDLVIFDEASQIYIENSLPSIYRAKKLIVLGDEKQLGPSNFFTGRKIVEDEEIEEDESLLTFAKIKFPTVMLKNHYRSEDVSLIDFSNQHFYEEELLFINNNKQKDNSYLPLEYIYVENAIYEDQMNFKEAEKTIEILLQKHLQNSKNSIGVITTNQKQKILIEDKILEQSSEFKTWLEKDVDFFCKSIENVQGDERDEIIIVTNFAPNANGVQAINFGPISGSLGSNRINVAITRSKKKMIIVSSMNLAEAKQKASNSKNKGPLQFIKFIEYVRDFSKTNSKPIDFIQNDLVFESFFEEEVYNEISNLLKLKFNYGILTQYKALNYRIDFVIYDLDTKQKVCALELDGASFHSSKIAREKDFYRQLFLESRGWIIYRIWSTNWWNNKQREIDKLIYFLENLN